MSIYHDGSAKSHRRPHQKHPPERPSHGRIWIPLRPTWQPRFPAWIHASYRQGTTPPMKRLQSCRGNHQRVGSLRYLTLAALVLLYPFAIRTMLILDRQVETEFIDTLGFLSDLSAGLLACFSIIVMLNHSRILAGIGGTLWLAINITAYEYIAFFDSPYALAQASFLVDRTFLAGSAMGMGYPLLHMTTWCALIWLIFSSKTPEK